MLHLERVVYALGCSYSISQGELLKNIVKPVFGDEGQRGRFSGPAGGMGIPEKPT